MDSILFNWKMFFRNDLHVIVSNLPQPRAAWMKPEVKIRCNITVSSDQLYMPSQCRCHSQSTALEATAQGKAKSWTFALSAAYAVKPHPSLW